MQRLGLIALVLAVLELGISPAGAAYVVDLISLTPAQITAGEQTTFDVILGVNGGSWFNEGTTLTVSDGRGDSRVFAFSYTTPIGKSYDAQGDYIYYYGSPWLEFVGKFTYPTAGQFNVSLTATGSYDVKFYDPTDTGSNCIDYGVCEGLTRSYFNVRAAQVLTVNSLPEVGAVPEPSTWAMMIFGFCGLGFMAYRRSNAARSLT